MWLADTRDTKNDWWKSDYGDPTKDEGLGWDSDTGPERSSRVNFNCLSVRGKGEGFYRDHKCNNIMDIAYFLCVQKEGVEEEEGKMGKNRKN